MNVSSVSPTCRKRRLNEAVSRDNRIKRVVPCLCSDRNVKKTLRNVYGVGA